MTVICVDPDDAARTTTADALEAAGLTVRGVGSAAAARDAVETATDLDAVVTENDLPDGTGLDLIGTVREERPDAVCVLYTDTDLAVIDTTTPGDVVAEYVPKSAGAERLTELIGTSVAAQTQTAYPLPDDEEARLAVLDRFAPDPEALSQSFERLTEVAVALFEVDAATVGLVDAHHERFVGCHGLDLETMNREDTVCTHAILDPSVTVVEDLTEDPRFADNEAIRALGTRFYAGAPVTVDGATIGVFCLYGNQPDTLSTRERELLELLADQAADHLVLNGRLQDALDDTEDDPENEGPLDDPTPTADGGESESETPDNDGQRGDGR